MYKCNIKIAGVPVLIRCRYPGNIDFFQEYFTQERERVTIEPSAEDMERMQADFDRMDEAEGVPRRQRSDSLLENNAIHSLLAEALVQEDVLLMHGSALCMDGEAYIFTAKSGTGKSTHARLWRECFGDRVWMINDDKPMPKAEAFPELLWQAFSTRNPLLMSRILKLEKQLLDTTEFYALGCNMEPEAATVAWEGMNVL